MTTDTNAANGAADVLTPERIASLGFDDALTELQRTVAALESGGLSLEASIALYERGVALHERCATLLGQAELRVQRLMERAGGALEAVDVPAVDEAGA
ncbi:MAG: exodeoxyribonuclease VII small subunit [Candidatus Limnocylindrales bacterium]